MRHVILTLVVFLLLAVQAPLLHVLGLAAWSLDVGLLAVLYLAATSSRLDGVINAAIIGFIVDSFTPGGVLGMHIEILSLMFLVAIGLAARVQMLQTLPLIVVAFVCSLMETLLFFLFSLLFDRNFGQYTAVLLWAVPHAFITAMLGPLVFKLLGAVDGRLRGKRVTGGGLFIK
jgi:rod shape-determining protein MreD